MTSLRNSFLALVHGAVIFASTWAVSHLSSLDPTLTAAVGGGATTVWLGLVKYLSVKFPKLAWLVGVVAQATPVTPTPVTPVGTVTGAVTTETPAA